MKNKIQAYNILLLTISIASLQVQAEGSQAPKQPQNINPCEGSYSPDPNADRLFLDPGEIIDCRSESGDQTAIVERSEITFKGFGPGKDGVVKVALVNQLIGQNNFYYNKDRDYHADFLVIPWYHCQETPPETKVGYRIVRSWGEGDEFESETLYKLVCNTRK